MKKSLAGIIASVLSVWYAQAVGQIPEPLSRTVTTARNAAALSVSSQNPAPSAGPQLRIDKIAPVLPKESQLLQNFPNPFNPATVIRYALPSAANVQLEVYSILGQKVRTLVDERKPAGNDEVRFDATSLASGVYFYRLRAGDYTGVKKMVVMK